MEGRHERRRPGPQPQEGHGELDGTYFPESFKGNHSKGSFTPPRRVRRRGGRVREATAILDELGLSMSTAVNAFPRAPVREGGTPFETRVGTPAPGGETAR